MDYSNKNPKIHKTLRSPSRYYTILFLILQKCSNIDIIRIYTVNALKILWIVDSVEKNYYVEMKNHDFSRIIGMEKLQNFFFKYYDCCSVFLRSEDDIWVVSTAVNYRYSILYWKWYWRTFLLKFCVEKWLDSIVSEFDKQRIRNWYLNRRL